jgi:hypothetical protein
MLVRFLSFAASIIGTRRYRPVLLSAAAVVFSVASAIVLGSVLTGRPHGAASTTGQSAQTKRQAASSLEGLDRQAPHEEPTPPPDNQNQTPANSENTAQGSTSLSGQNSSPVTDVSLSTSSITLSSTNPMLSVNAASSDKSTLNWALSTDAQDSGITATIEQNGAQSNVTIRFRLGHTDPGTYQFVITAKDPSRSIDLSKKLTVTVNP